MKALKYTILSLMFGGLVVSCDFLDKEPTKLTLDNYFTTADEASSFLTGIYAELGQSTFYGADYLYLVGGDDLEHYGGVNRSPVSSGLICNNATSSDAAVTGFWYTLYSGINRANLFLENIDRVSDINEGVKAQYVAEARFLRAFYYFNLVQCWGDVPFRTTATSDVIGLDAPREDKQKIYDFIISEMEDVSDEENGGLLTAAELNYMPGHVSKSAAWGILARVFLFRAGEWHRDNRAATEVETTTYFSEASKYAKKVMTLGNHDLTPDYWDFFIDLCTNRYNSSGKNESIWEAEFAGNNTTDIKAEGRIGNIIGLAAPDMSSKSSVVGSADPGFSYEFIFATPKLYKLYGTDIAASTLADPASAEAKALREKDVRYYWNIAPFKYVEAGGKNTGVTGREFYEQAGLNFVLAHDNGRSYSYGDKDVLTTASYVDYARACAKFRREYEADKKDKNSTAINFPILRYSDVLLMFAEAENEVNGPTDEARNALYKVRSRAGLTEALPSMSKDQFRQAVKDERARELCFEYTRHFDLIRWGEFVNNMNALVEEATNGQSSGWKQGPSNVYTYFQVSSAYNYFPIPEAEMAVNKAITENNPGW